VKDAARISAARQQNENPFTCGIARLITGFRRSVAGNLVDLLVGQFDHV
jgi:hypothetical protein